MDANSGDFRLGRAIARPDARQFRYPVRADFKLLQRINENLLDGANICAYIALPQAKVNDGIGDNLSGAMIGDVAAAIGFVQFDAMTLEDPGWRQQIFGMSVAADGDHVRVLNEQQRVDPGARFALRR